MQNDEQDNASPGVAVDSPFRPANDPDWTHEAWYLEWKRLAAESIPE